MAIMRRWYNVEVMATVRGRKMIRSYRIEAPGPNEARRTVKERLEMSDPEVVGSYKITKVVRA
ncbi:hypothetical protein [Porphyromonas somerae]|uniref:hypothetical protein n=1 Tax=Porphyromonas somerae TaxID=322095 RepID=UPI001FCB3484|nr:hypothetical protein [Porphyromonas somerae]BDE81303.1 hypothetical protein CE91St14_03310 [Porphyromonas somerae]